MSHELRTPLNAIIGFAQLLEMDEVSAERCQNLEQILKGGHHLLGLINEVLDIARIDAGHISLSREPVHLRDLTDEAVALMRPLAIPRSIHLENNIVGGFVTADQQRLKQVLMNLLSNAVKYNREGGVIRLTGGGQSHSGRVRFEITDTGPGISPAGLQKIFVPFERLDAASHGIQGTGIGLSICEKLVRLMDGEIGVSSVENVGTSFWVELPAAQNPMDSLEPDETTDQTVGRFDGQPLMTGSPGTSTILYIEDNLSNLNLVESILSRHSEYRLLSAMQGRRGLELAREHSPDLILLDLHLPDMLGDEVLEHLREGSRTRTIPVVMLSADATPRQIERLLEAGAKDYLTKPLDVKHFLKVLDENLTA
jgi:CheY-like chemotaxis protein/anti-sigma regulatory factor (Ser/Thr protein kinase)